MEATVVNMCKRYESCEMRRQKEQSKQDGINKTNLYLNNTYNENI